MLMGAGTRSLGDLVITPMAAPPTILATSRLNTRIQPVHAAKASLSGEKQLARQTAHAQMRVQYVRALPVTQQRFYEMHKKTYR
jgi:hypothetical protein